MDWRVVGNKALYEFEWLLGLVRLRRRRRMLPLLRDFQARCRGLHQPRVLELGAKRSIPTRSTLHGDWVPHAREYLGSDIAPGPDVDIVADVHRLTDVVGREAFDVIIACSTFEHFKYPHLAAHQMLQALKVGGLLFVQTHQTYGLHGFPCDYFRFSTEALAGLFGTRLGFTTLGTCYEAPVNLHAPEVPLLWVLPAYLNACLFGQKTGPTPEEFVYELDRP